METQTGDKEIGLPPIPWRVMIIGSNPLLDAKLIKVLDERCPELKVVLVASAEEAAKCKFEPDAMLVDVTLEDPAFVLGEALASMRERAKKSLQILATDCLAPGCVKEKCSWHPDKTVGNREIDEKVLSGT